MQLYWLGLRYWIWRVLSQEGSFTWLGVGAGCQLGCLRSPPCGLFNRIAWASLYSHWGQRERKARERRSQNRSFSLLQPHPKRDRPSLLLCSSHYNQVTKANPHSRRGELSSTPQKKMCQRICGHTVKLPPLDKAILSFYPESAK